VYVICRDAKKRASNASLFDNIIGKCVWFIIHCMPETLAEHIRSDEIRFTDKNIKHVMVINYCKDGRTIINKVYRTYMRR